MSGIKCICPNGMIDVMINLNSLKPKQTNTKTIGEKIITPNGKILIICWLHFQLSSMAFVIKSGTKRQTFPKLFGNWKFTSLGREHYFV